MKAELTPKIFRYISQEISNGRPIWGMLRANEYLEANNPLRQALAEKAKTQLIDAKLELVKEVMSGTTLGELSNSQVKEIRELNERLTKNRQDQIHLPNRRSFSNRRRTLRRLRA